MTDALFVLEDGSVFRGRSFGAPGEAFGEAVFNTAMSGYQEVLTDPSYAGQIVTMTSPHQGNYGVNDEDVESATVRVAGFVVRQASRRPSSWRSRTSLADYVSRAGVVALEGIDTRSVTRRIREGGAMRAGISTIELDPAALLQRVRHQAGMKGAELAAGVSTPTPHDGNAVAGAPTSEGKTLRVAAYDYGIKWNIVRKLAEYGCETTIFPAATSPSEILAGGFDGVFFSNGPGDPEATTYGIDAVRAFLGEIPIFAICLGHQLLAHALGGRTYKLRFGHRGVNQPVKDLDSGRVEITSHNHGFAVDAFAWAAEVGPASRGQPPPNPTLTRAAPPPIRLALPAEPPIAQTSFGRVALTHWNLNDGTLEGLRCLDIPAFSVQYHPEASPGPHDSRHLFRRFRELMA